LIDRLYSSLECIDLIQMTDLKKLFLVPVFVVIVGQAKISPFTPYTCSQPCIVNVDWKKGKHAKANERRWKEIRAQEKIPFLTVTFVIYAF